MDLILWRHADAREPDPERADEDGGLTSKGERQAARMAQWLNRHLPASTRVLVSPALRTRQTAEALGRKFKLAPEAGPQGSVEALLHAARWPDCREPVLVVGHQEVLGLTAAYLMAGATQPWLLRKGSIWWMRYRQRNGEERVSVHTVLSPDQAV